MSAHPTLQTFVDDELLRAPLAFDQVIDTVLEQWRQTLGRHGEQSVRQLQLHRGDLIAEALRSLRAQVATALSHGGESRPAAGTTRSAPLELSLIDEDEVAVDIELSRSIEAIKLQAEVELRELQTYTSALVGDPNVSRDSNPFRPEVYVRALWQGAQTLPLPRPTQAAFLRDAAEPLAKALRQGYAAACSRLDEQGVEPAAFRTIVAAGGTRLPGTDSVVLHNDALHQLHARQQDLRAAFAAGADSAPQATAGSGLDPQLVELLSRLFDALQRDRMLSQNSLSLLLRLQPTALRLALLDPSLLDHHEHPVWRFMDRSAHLIEYSRAADAARSLGFVRNLVDHLLADTRPNDAGRFEWALERLSAFERHQFEQALGAARPEIESLQRTVDTQSAPVTASGQPLDIATMDTVPAQLLPAETNAADELPPLAPGDRLRAYLQGEWRLLQLLWIHPQHECWLLLDQQGHYFARRPRALQRLAAVRLAQPLPLRSLIRSAAARVLRAIDAPPH